MVYTLYKPNLWRYFKGDFLYRINERYTKAVNILTAVVIGGLVLAGLFFCQSKSGPLPVF